MGIGILRRFVLGLDLYLYFDFDSDYNFDFVQEQQFSTSY